MYVTFMCSLLGEVSWPCLYPGGGGVGGGFAQGFALTSVLSPAPGLGLSFPRAEPLDHTRCMCGGAQVQEESLPQAVHAQRAGSPS